MPTITIYQIENLEKDVSTTTNRLKEVKDFSTKLSKYNSNEIFIQYWYSEDIEETLRNLDDDVKNEIVSFLVSNGKKEVLKRVYAFINLITNTLEIYDTKKNKEIIELIENCLGITIKPIAVTYKQLKEIEKNHSNETKTLTENQLIFKPKIKYLNNINKYFVTLKDNEIKLGNNDVFKYRPRFEIRQILFIVAECLGLLKNENLVKVSG